MSCLSAVSQQCRISVLQRQIRKVSFCGLKTCIFVYCHEEDGLGHLRYFKIFLTSSMLRKFSSRLRPDTDSPGRQSTDFDCWLVVSEQLICLWVVILAKVVTWSHAGVLCL